jgi:transposase
MLAYSMDLRERVLADSDAGMPTKEVAEKYKVCRAWVRRLKQRRRQTGEVAPRSSRNTLRPKLEPYYERIGSLIAAQPDMTLRELRDRLAVTVSLASLWTAVNKLGLTLKKSPSRR